MKIKSDYKLRKVANEYVVVAVGRELSRFNGMISLNETGAFLWKLLEQEISKEDVVERLCQEFQVTNEKAAYDVNVFVEKLRDAGVLEEYSDSGKASGKRGFLRGLFHGR